MSIDANKYALIVKKPNEIQTHRYGSYEQRFMQKDIYWLALMMKEVILGVKK